MMCCLYPRKLAQI